MITIVDLNCKNTEFIPSAYIVTNITKKSFENLRGTFYYPDKKSSYELPIAA
jgi:hypothetical protein